MTFKQLMLIHSVLVERLDIAYDLKNGAEDDLERRIKAENVDDWSVSKLPEYSNYQECKREYAEIMECIHSLENLVIGM